jgi:hypothetical protein
MLRYVLCTRDLLRMRHPCTHFKDFNHPHAYHDDNLGAPQAPTHQISICGMYITACITILMNYVIIPSTFLFREVTSVLTIISFSSHQFYVDVEGNSSICQAEMDALELQKMPSMVLRYHSMQ